MHSIKLSEEKPKLYITQPSLSNPTRTMQSFYHSGDSKEASETSNQEVGDQESEEELESKNTVNSFKKKAFNEMTIEEKVMYFSSQPFHAPKLTCQIVTKEKTMIGIIEEYQGNTVKIKAGKKSNLVSIAMDQIEEINLIGF